MSTTHNTPVRTTCRTTSEFKGDLMIAVLVLQTREQQLLTEKTIESLREAFVLRECAGRIIKYVDRAKLEGM
jgi:hypothetical protein